MAVDEGISLIITKGGEALDISELVKKVQWKGRKGSSSRTITVNLIDDDGYKHARSGIDVEEGYQCIFRYDGAELFRGVIMKQTQGDDKMMSFTAYDNGIYLANNRDTFCYENKTATEVFKDCCTRFGIPTGEVANCSYKIPELTKSKTTAWDTIADALSLDFDATGIRHYVSCSGGKVSLLTRRENILQWVIEPGANLTGYSYTRSIEDIKTRVKMVSKEGTTIAEKSNSSLESKIGIFQEIDQPEESLTTAQINDLIDSMLEEKSTPERTLSVDSIGIPDVVSGIGIYVIIPPLNISRTFYVDEDTHTFEDRSHTMSLKLTFATDVTKEDKSDDSGDYKVGDIVQFKGGYHYVSSTASSPASTNLRPGPAKITLIAKGAKHPYHLIHTDSSTMVYGWVDKGTFTKKEG